LKGFYGKTLRPLSDSTLTSGKFNVVVFDSPWPLAVGKDYPTSRATSDHLARIDSVVDFYRNKYNKPIWLMGHSNGAVSVTEFYKYLQKNNREKIISGIIYSSARNGANFNAETNIPVLFLAHEKDGCSRSSPQNSQSVFNDLKKTNKFKTEYILLKAENPRVNLVILVIICFLKQKKMPTKLSTYFLLNFLNKIIYLINVFQPQEQPYIPFQPL
jgi:hypothetical protein